MHRHIHLYLLGHDDIQAFNHLTRSNSVSNFLTPPTPEIHLFPKLKEHQGQIPDRCIGKSTPGGLAAILQNSDPACSWLSSTVTVSKLSARHCLTTKKQLIDWMSERAGFWNGNPSMCLILSEDVDPFQVCNIVNVFHLVNIQTTDVSRLVLIYSKSLISNWSKII